MATRRKAAKKKKGKPSKGKTVTIKKPGKKPIRFNKGALHRALGVPEGRPIPESKKRAALAGRYGEKVRRMAVLAFKGALAAGRKTAAKRRSKGRKRTGTRKRRA